MTIIDTRPRYPTVAPHLRRISELAERASATGVTGPVMCVSYASFYDGAPRTPSRLRSIGLRIRLGADGTIADLLPPTDWAEFFPRFVAAIGKDADARVTPLVDTGVFR